MAGAASLQLPLDAGELAFEATLLICSQGAGMPVFLPALYLTVFSAANFLKLRSTGIECLSIATINPQPTLFKSLNLSYQCAGSSFNPLSWPPQSSRFEKPELVGS